MQKKLTKILACSLMALTILGLGACGNDDQSAGGAEKTITVEVTHKDGTVNTQETTTKGENLINVLDELSMVDPSSGDDGYYTTVDGETANTDAEEWWCLTIDGESAITGFDDTPIEDGKKYELTFTEGW